MRIFLFIINTIYRLLLFIVPASILGFISALLYLKSKDDLFFSVIIGIAGISFGIALAEYVRRKYGLNSFFSRIHATPDIDGIDPLENKKKHENE